MQELNGYPLCSSSLSLKRSGGSFAKCLLLITYMEIGAEIINRSYLKKWQLCDCVHFSRLSNFLGCAGDRGGDGGYHSGSDRRAGWQPGQDNHWPLLNRSGMETQSRATHVYFIVAHVYFMAVIHKQLTWMLKLLLRIPRAGVSPCSQVQDNWMHQKCVHWLASRSLPHCKCMWLSAFNMFYLQALS